MLIARYGLAAVAIALMCFDSILTITVGAIMFSVAIWPAINRSVK